jgi:ER-bound oxygenase mpaB/B'/Rubber oxygenase, catalytic domain
MTTVTSSMTSVQPEPLGRGPLGPESLTWKYFGDLRTGMMGVWIGAIQNMYPELGAGVEEHSILLREPLQRVARSVYPIMGVVYDGNRAAKTGEQIKQYHHTIKGVDGTGRRYHALNPETFYWAHATFFMLVIKVAEYFCGGLTEGEKRQPRRACAVVSDVRDEHAAGTQVVGRLPGVLAASLPRRARDQSGHSAHLPDSHSQTEVRADAHPGVGSAVQAAGRGAALDRGGAVRAGRSGEGRNAVDTRRRSGAAAVRQDGRAGVSGGP